MTQGGDINMFIILPEIFLGVMACVVLVVGSITKLKQTNLSFILTLLALGLSAISIILLSSNEASNAFNGLIIKDGLSDVAKFMICVFTILILVYGHRYFKEISLYGSELFTLILLGTLGMMVMVSSVHLISLYLGLELMALSLYALIALRSNSIESTESAMKYFVLGALASGILLYGISFIYGSIGSLDFESINQSMIEESNRGLAPIFALIMILVGLLFKFGVFPFHMWVPDVYQGSPTPITGLVASVTKIAALVVFLRLIAISFESFLDVWQGMLIVVALLSIAFGNLVAIAQRNIKRMLAYSTISHMGFVLLGILTGDEHGQSAALLYVLIYAGISVGVFGCIILLAFKGFEADNLDDYRGLSEKDPWLAFLLLLFMFSLAGVPPTIGFYAKLSILQALIGSGLMWVAIPSVMVTVVGAFYYLRVIKLMYFDKPDVLGQKKSHARTLDVRTVLILNGFLSIGIMPWAGSILIICQNAIRSMG